MTNEERMKRVEAAAAQAKAFEEAVAKERASVLSCASCRYRGTLHTLFSAHARCLNPLDTGPSLRRQRGETGMCGPQALLRKYPRWWQIIRWTRWLCGQR